MNFDELDNFMNDNLIDSLENIIDDIPNDDIFESLSSYGLEQPVFRSTTILNNSNQVEPTIWSNTTTTKYIYNDTQNVNKYQYISSSSLLSNNEISIAYNTKITTANTKPNTKPKSSNNMILKPVPQWLDYNYSFLSQRYASDIYDRLLEILTRLHILYDDSQRNQGIIHGITNICGCDFNIHIYKWSKDQIKNFPTLQDHLQVINIANTVVEIHRCSGDTIYFSKFYQNFIQMLGKCTILCKFNNQAKQLRFKTIQPKLNKSELVADDDDLSLTINQDCIKKIFTMCHSKFNDIKVQGISTLVNLITSHGAKHIMKHIALSSKVIANNPSEECPMKILICNGLSSTCPELRRLSSELYKQVAKELEKCNKLTNAIKDMKLLIQENKHNINDYHGLRDIDLHNIHTF